ncbi:metal-dependent hydrolase [uncultured Thalassolituus sp.]|uniref:metal-dependent hydrolase n=1 Tax=uncultured Thalassolituus sp. TaxID=285273 RepID=UPI00260EF94A|nr:metal-dependent hydrolase [uncultured Thalassolituus sp.]
MTGSIPLSTPMIEVRRMDFDFGKLDQQDWYRNNPVLTAFMSVLSGTFPPGEQMFIESVRHYKDRVSDPELLAHVADFTRQEAHHTNQHKLANEALESLGWKAQEIERRVEKAIGFFNHKRTPRERLAATVCLEHITAIVAEYVLTHPQQLEGMHPSIKYMMIWHAIEEIEHKSVAFDVYMTTGGKRSTLRRIMKAISVLFPALTVGRTFYLLWAARRMPSWAQTKEAWTMLFGKDGMITCIKAPFKDFYRDDFHPEDHDNRELIERWKAEIEAWKAS